MKFSLAYALKVSPFLQIFKLNDDKSILSMCAAFTDGPVQDGSTILGYVNLEDFKDAFYEYGNQICPTCYKSFENEYLDDNAKDILNKKLFQKIINLNIVNADYLIINPHYYKLLQKTIINGFGIPIVISETIQRYDYRPKSVPFITDDIIHANLLFSQGWTIYTNTNNNIPTYYCFCP